ncbi:MAG: PAS domain S-box protein [Mariprofundaceae bacterium]|nr:PAS domain S-box protein [Mariprofundaceae bacterium]
MNKRALPAASVLHSIFGELMLLMTAILVPFGLIVGFYVFDQVNQAVEKQYLQSLKNLAEEKASTINDYIDAHLKHVEEVSHVPSVRYAMAELTELFHAGGIDSPAYKQAEKKYDAYFKPYVDRDEDYELFMIDVEGNIVYSIKHESDFATNLKTGPYRDTGLAQVFRQALNNLQVSNSSFAYYEPSKESAAFIATPMIYNKQVVGVVALQFDTQRFYEVINNYTGLGETGEVVVGQKMGDHVLITAPLRHDTHAAFQRSIALNAPDALPIREGSQGETGADKLVDWRGQEVLAVWQYIPALQWGMVVKIDTQEAFSDWYGLRKSLIFYSILALLLTYIILFIGTQRVTRPLRQLTKASVDIASGKDDVQLPKSTGNELGILSDAFYSMAQKLQASKKSLQQTVESLAESNRILDQRVAEKTEHIRAVIENAVDGIITMNEQGIIKSISPMVGHIFDYQEEELIGQKMTKLMPEKYMEMHLQGLQRCREGKNSGPVKITAELEGLRKSGEVFPVELRVNEMNVAGQKLFLGTLRDISERKKMEADQQRLSMAVEQTQDAIMITDMQGMIEYVNPAYQALSGFSADELIGQTPKIVQSGEMPDSFYKKMWEKLLSGQVWSGEFINKHKNGELYEVEQSISPIFDASENIMGFTSVQRDITGEKKEREKLEHIQRLESLGVLAGGIAHDFNNLLTAIMGNAALAKLKIDSLSPATPLLSNIEQASDRAAALCKQMLAYSGKGKFIVEPVNLSHLVHEMMNLLQVSIDKNVVMRLNLAEQLLPIEADVAQMQQVIMNLVINASEAIDKHSGTLTIYTGVVDIDAQYIATTYVDSDLKTGRYVCLEVSDTGCGMDEKTQKHLFDPFFTTKFTGRGLGMSAILGIIRGHHGGIKVYSELGKGTTFKILFPCCDVLEAETKAESEVVIQKQGQGTVLIIDDEETIRVTASMMLESFGFATLTAQDGEVGVQVFREHQGEISAVLLDMTMPKMNGEECFRALRAIDSDVTVILSSGYNEQDATNRFAGKGLAGFIQKPYLPGALRDMFFKALDQ